ncbi:TPA: oligopeptide transporter, OPT family, partial [Staphylococcus aureus]|nr:oligopeptide transporter, OPT family [Staphylococcus aureus]
LGVMYSIPLRRALVTGSDLPYPEGVAAAEVLKVGADNGASAAAHEENAKGLRVILVGGIISAAMALLAAMKAVASSVSTYFKLGSGATTLGTSLSMALIGVGHLVGMSVGIAMLVGVVISFFILLPMHTAGDIGGLDATALADTVDSVFSGEIRFIGVGAMAIAAIWTLLKITGPIVKGISESLASSR